MAILYNLEENRLFKNCNCGGALPTYDPVFFRPGRGTIMSEAEFTKMIRDRRVEERTLSGSDAVDYRAKTNELRTDRRKTLQTMTKGGFSHAGIYFTDGPTSVILEADGEATIIPKEDYEHTLKDVKLKEYKPRPSKRRY